MEGIYKYTDLETGEVVYVGKDSHIDKNERHKDHMAPSIVNVDIEKLEAKVKAKGLVWRRIKND